MTNTNPIRLGIVGVGKIVRDQHLPAVAGSPDFALVAAASRNATVDDVANFGTIEEMLGGADVDAVSLCMPPRVRYAAARSAIEAGKHVFLEKPPGATVSEIEDLKALARTKGVSLFASWHSRYAPAVEAARDFMAGAKTVSSVAIIWKEDVRRWHPGQAWIWQPGGFGVFDPGINALSIATHIVPHAFFVSEATLDFPANRDTPVAARVTFASAGGYPVSADLDWLQTGPQTWNIVAETDRGRMVLSGGGSKLIVDDKVVHEEPEREYPVLYERFATLIRDGRSDVDVTPLQHVADAFMLGKRNVVEAFYD
jgi:D-galactose 1-dehydrogenase